MSTKFKQEQPWRIWINGRLYETTGELSQQSEESDRLILYNLHVIKCPGHANPYPVVRDITPEPKPSAEAMAAVERWCAGELSPASRRQLALLIDEQRLEAVTDIWATWLQRVGVRKYHATSEAEMAAKRLFGLEGDQWDALVQAKLDALWAKEEAKS